MEKQKISLDQLLAGALLRFESIDKYDLSILIGMVDNCQNIEFVSDDLNSIKTYIDVNGEKFSMKRNRVDSNKCTRMFVKELESIQGDAVASFINQLDVKELVLKKIELLNGIPYDNMLSFLNGIQFNEISKLLCVDLIKTKWNDDIPHQNYREVVITKAGSVYIFVKNNVLELKGFLEEMQSREYNLEIIDDFLLAQDLSKPASEILTIENFERYGNIHDRYLWIGKRSK